MWNDIARSQARVTGCTIVAVVLTLPHATGASQVSWVAGAGEPGVGDGGSVAAGHKAAARSGAGLRAEIRRISEALDHVRLQDPRFVGVEEGHRPVRGQERVDVGVLRARRRGQSR